MKFGIREICNVVLKAKSSMKLGSKVFYKNEPVLYFDTLKTSTMEGSVTTVYAQGGRGNSRLVAWDGERTVTFTMEDALISAEGLSLLIGANLVEADSTNKLVTPAREVIDLKDKTHIYTGTDSLVTPGETKTFTIKLDTPTNGSIQSIDVTLLKDTTKVNKSVIMAVFLKDGEEISEPYYGINVSGTVSFTTTAIAGTDYVIKTAIPSDANGVAVYYDIVHTSGVKQLTITPDITSHNFYLEAETLFRDQDGIDWPAVFIIPNCKIQSNFSFSMAASGDPSTFTFTMDAFPGYTRFDTSTKVFADIQIIEGDSGNDAYRKSTNHS